jgi:isochorismate synthase
LWRLPNQNKINAAIGLIKQITPSQLDINTSESCFCLAPFINPGGTRSLLIRSDFSYNTATRKLVENPETDKSEPTRKMKARFVDEFNNRVVELEKEPYLWHNCETPPLTQNDKKNYRRLVEDGIKHIAEGKFKKLVLSRTKVVKLRENFQAIEYFDKLCREYPTAFVALVSIPLIGTWMVATPETLASIDKNNNFHTMALAGTQQTPADSSVDPESVWSQKERDEQRLVSQYIIEFFKEIGVQGYERKGPYTVQAGHILHRADFTESRR